MCELRFFVSTSRRITSELGVRMDDLQRFIQTAEDAARIAVQSALDFGASSPETSGAVTSLVDILLRMTSYEFPEGEISDA
jgi:hypothetical protein